MKLSLTFLGTGTSQGIPMIACDCPVCTSADPRDKRMRCSSLVSAGGRNILIDCTPELRLQCLTHKVERIDAVLITHTHADHIFGLDDLRRFNQLQNHPIPVYAMPDHIHRLDKLFGYARADRAGDNPDLPKLVFTPITGPFDLFGLNVNVFSLPHGQAQSTAFRLGPLGYCTDVSMVPDEVINAFLGVNVLVLGALRPEPHPAHLSLDQAVIIAQRIRADRTYLVHVNHHVSHACVEADLPDTIHLAYDGLNIVLNP
ncbi:MAG: MBL fold metallo-hydrolase [Sedimentisphaerales bacterium]|nr:MBL fold metallo-hydrolase [Sedimentisphaerales bacterium]